VAVTPDTDEVVGAITASMEIENQNEVRGMRGTARPTEIDVDRSTCIAAVFLMLTRRWCGHRTAICCGLSGAGTRATWSTFSPLESPRATDGTASVPSKPRMTPVVCRVCVCVSWRIGNVCPGAMTRCD
jgi:hypothetical protein